jgi:alkylation response protein AidB-like acyl-CoA dehydrogenase
VFGFFACVFFSHDTQVTHFLLISNGLFGWGLPYHLEATMAKLVASEGALHAGRFGAEIMGGYGICMEYPMQRYLRDAYQLQFSPISNEMSKNMLMQFQGLPKSWA